MAGTAATADGRASGVGKAAGAAAGPLDGPDKGRLFPWKGGWHPPPTIHLTSWHGSPFRGSGASRHRGTAAILGGRPGAAASQRPGRPRSAARGFWTPTLAWGQRQDAPFCRLLLRPAPGTPRPAGPGSPRFATVLAGQGADRGGHRPAGPGSPRFATGWPDKKDLKRLYPV